MKPFLKLIGWACVLLVALGISYTLYSYFLVDYSLENLELALSVSDKAADKSRMERKAYRSLIDDMVVEEAVSGLEDSQNMALLEIASRSFDETIEKAGGARAHLYLSQTLASKRNLRHFLLRMLDKLYEWGTRLRNQLARIFQYFGKVIHGGPDEIVSTSGELFLARAEEKEKAWKLEEAAELYRKFLSAFPRYPDRPYVVISLVNVLMKQHKYTESERLLKELMLSSMDQEVYRLAAGLTERLRTFRRLNAKIENLKDRLLDVEGKPEEEGIRFQLGMLCLRTYALAEAQSYFHSVSQSRHASIRSKSKFYEAWILKLQAQYDQGEELLTQLLQDESLDRDFQMGLAAQLADIFYQTGELSQALEYYEKILKKSEEEPNEVIREGWQSLSDAESAVIYYFDLHDVERGQKHLRHLGQIFPEYGKFLDLKSAVEYGSRVELRDLAFIQLKRGRLMDALELFKKKLKKDDKDAWSYSGMGSVYALLGDLNTALSHAEKGYGLTADEYTASLCGYIETYRKNQVKAMRYYRQAIERAPNGDYIPAQYNLSSLLLKRGRFAEGLERAESLNRLFANHPNRMASKILNNAGYALGHLGRPGEAIERFLRALDITPEFEDAKTNLQILSGYNGTASPPGT
jgi:tetratricopeptide (TPR) repeat protein